MDVGVHLSYTGPDGSTTICDVSGDNAHVMVTTADRTYAAATNVDGSDPVTVRLCETPDIGTVEQRP